ncbi:response regulator [Sulfobacillus thermosulfidooxidans]|uniref:Stage 0 sporulation protein A homolog n=1 Tax=Sulfobacillus thermosulfidooxidans TaxID=28034 RepID=A0A1R0IKR7_SULTH|nr:response regulator transcription factor [Sulfobacillus thermosulfidooxidans]OLZ10875.1 DNA-binding response regulator [Sulfobacillus thermosulfidooxidans]OLZ14363.1 DNA-binding response regulator [Sulfobacillus thermosulfidooxidans]OLZ19106.1 DNA-binding response regulator [Sulfobacillus thermosulfidooxidans]PSR28514.1 MAG: DNA-binding response regulator [Sulfobacillus thermosulfidooxidans]
MPQRVLVVDDEKAIVELVAYNLRREGFDVLTEYDGQQGLKRALQDKPDLVVLDVMLPGLSGLDVCRSIRHETDIPVIMLTARKDELDRILGLELGADDYVTKPFSPRELVARVKAILRRVKRPADKDTTEPEVVEHSGLKIEFDKREVLLDGTPLPLTFTEFELLSILAKNPGRAFTRDDLLIKVWGQDFFGDARTVDVHIRHLREKLQEDLQSPRFIETVRGVGYRFKEL